MNQLQFVFSKKTKWVFYRHTCFWLCWYLFQVYLYAFIPSPILPALGFTNRILLTATESLFYILPSIFLSYTLMYWVIPKMVIPAKYLKAIVWVLALLMVTGALSAIVSLTVLDYLRKLYFSHYFGPVIGSSTPFGVKFFLALMGGLRGSITIGGMAAAIKLMKYFYEKQQEAVVLQQEKAVAELASLKAQLHPHFLFNTLNNIYAHTQDVAPVAADMLIGLSTLLRYILYSCNAPLVYLEQEISMINEYIDLEKKRYGNQLEIAVQVPDNYRQLMIAPLLILPFVENCFKHGTADMLDKPWINIHISLDADTMHLKIINGKAINKRSENGGIGISNVRRRLELLYPAKHQLDIMEEDDVYIVNLRVQLGQHTTPAPQTKPQVNEFANL